MQNKQIKQIIDQLADHEARLKTLETGPQLTTPASNVSKNGKQKTLRELIKGKKFKSGQERVAAIIGYHEKVLGQRVLKNQIKDEWVNAKMNGKFSDMFISRAKDTLIRVLTDGTCDLTQTGEEFFDQLLNNEPIDTTSK